MRGKKQKIEPIEGLAPEEKLTVQKSQPLLSLWQSDMTLGEFRILDTYLSRIDSHKPDKRTVVFTRGELEKLLGVKQLKKDALSQRLKNLGRFVEIAGSDKETRLVALFEEASGKVGANGLWEIRLTCTTTAMEYIFNVEELGYLRYKLHSILSLSSRYSYILFLYLERNRFRRTWTVDVNELRHQLACDQDASYDAYKVFNDRILKRCHAEIMQKTDTRYTYEPVKVGRNVVALKFCVETLAVLDSKAAPIDPNQLSLFADHLVMLRDIFAAYAMPDADLELVYQQLLGMPESALPQDPGGGSELVARQAQYLRIIAARLARSRKPIPHPCNYICTIIRNEAAAAQTKQEQTAKQSDYWGGRNQVTDLERDLIARMMREEQELEAAEKEK